MKYLTKFILPGLFLLLTVSPAYFIYEDWFLLPLTIFLLLIFFFTNKKINRILFFFILYWTCINLISSVRFQQSFVETSYTFFGTLMRLTLVYTLIKLGGNNIFYNVERLSFIFITVGIPIFLLTESFPFVLHFLKKFDIGSMSGLADYGGWNILFYNYHPSAGFRFSGFAWEPGACALIIIFSLIICIQRDGFKIDYRKIIYISALILTFSTAGYLALGILIIIYAFNSSRKSIIYFIIILILFIPLSKFAYKQEFMSEKIGTYITNNEKLLETGIENNKYKKLTRLEVIYMGAILLKKWPIGYGITTKGRFTNNMGSELYGSNAIVEYSIQWGLIGLYIFLYSIYRYSRLQYILHNRNKSYYFLILPLIIMLLSNPVSRTPLFVGLMFYSFLYYNKYIAYINNIN